jgi:hypothetical protein
MGGGLFARIPVVNPVSQFLDRARNDLRYRPGIEDRTTWLKLMPICVSLLLWAEIVGVSSEEP